jgi:hypothetical protein
LHFQVYIYPDTAENKNAFAKAIPSLHLPLRTSSPGQHRLMGHQFILNTALSDKFIAYPTWTLSLPPEEDIQSLVPSLRGPIASIGKVLGNRTTLYKYLNPRLFAMLTASRSISPPTCAVYLIDSAKGSIIYRATLPSSAGHCDVKVSLTENWLIYHYFDGEFDSFGQAKGYRMVSVELYEGKHIDDKTKRHESLLSLFVFHCLKLLSPSAPICHPSRIQALMLRPSNSHMSFPMASLPFPRPRRNLASQVKIS